MQLRDRGLLSLDDPVVKYVPELRQVHNPFGDMSQVTIRHLMSHSAGIPRRHLAVGRRPAVASLRADRVGAARGDVALHRACCSSRARKYRYSNPGIIFLGRIIELLSGDDYEVYITKNILMPLGMHAHVLRPRAVSPARAPIAQLLRATTPGSKELRFDFDTGITVSNGGLNAPLDDMAKYLAFLIGGCGERAGYEGVLKRASLEEMWTPQIRASDGEGGSGSDVAGGAVVLRRAPRQRRADRPQRRPERLHLAPLYPSSVAYGVRGRRSTPIQRLRRTGRGLARARPTRPFGN